MSKPPQRRPDAEYDVTTSAIDLLEHLLLSPARTASMADLNAEVGRSDPFFRVLWERHRTDGDFIVFADVRRDDCRVHLPQWWGPAMVDRALSFAREHNPGFLGLPYLQDERAVEALLKSPSENQRLAGREIRMFGQFASLGAVPVFVVTQGGFWVTQWEAPGATMGVYRAI